MFFIPGFVQPLTTHHERACHGHDYLHHERGCHSHVGRRHNSFTKSISQVPSNKRFACKCSRVYLSGGYPEDFDALVRRTGHPLLARRSHVHAQHCRSFIQGLARDRRFCTTTNQQRNKNRERKKKKKRLTQKEGT